MTKAEIITRLDSQLLKMQEQLNLLKSVEGKIPKIELDRMLSDIRASYELFTVLNYLNTYHQETAVAEIQTEPVKIIPPVQEIQPEPIQEKEIKEIIQPVIKEEPIIKEEPAPVMVAKEEKPAPEIQPEPEKKEVSKSTTLNDKNAVKTQERISDKFHQAKIPDIKKAIPLHEKFQFINELFRGENAPYNEFLEKINAASGIEEARNIVQHTAIKYDWDIENKSFQQLNQFVLRRHA